VKMASSVVVTCSVLASFTSGAVAAERRIDSSKLPASVEKSVQRESHGATVNGFSTEVEGGKRLYEVEMIVNGHTKDISFGEDGAIVEIEEEVAMGSLPANVQTGLRAKAGPAKIVKVESLRKKGSLVAYEAATLNGSKRGEVQVGPTGETLAHEE